MGGGVRVRGKWAGCAGRGEGLGGREGTGDGVGGPRGGGIRVMG